MPKPSTDPPPYRPLPRLPRKPDWSMWMLIVYTVGMGAYTLYALTHPAQ